MERGLFPHQVKFRELNPDDVDGTILDPDFGNDSDRKPVMEKKTNHLPEKELTIQEKAEIGWRFHESRPLDEDCTSIMYMIHTLNEEAKQRYIDRGINPYAVNCSELQLDDMDSEKINPHTAMRILSEKLETEKENRRKELQEAKKIDEDW